MITNLYGISVGGRAFLPKYIVANNYIEAIKLFNARYPKDSISSISIEEEGIPVQAIEVVCKDD